MINMFALIHKNLRTDRVAIFISKSTFYRWLNGTKPMLWHLSALDEAFKTNTSLAYVRKFSNMALQLSVTNETTKVVELLSSCSLLEEDKKLLGNYHKNRIWGKST